MFRRKKATDGAGRLREVSFFEGFTDEELDRVAELVDEVEAERGAELTDQGRPGLECYIIQEGTANVFFGGEHIATLGPGSMLGEMALIDHRPRSATVTATSPMRLLAFDAQRFRRLLDEMPEALIRVMERLIERKKRNADGW